MKTMDVTQGDGADGDAVRGREQALAPQPIERRTFLAGAWAALAGGFLSPVLGAAASIGAEPQPVAVAGIGFDAGSGDTTVMWEANWVDSRWLVRPVDEAGRVTKLEMRITPGGPEDLASSSEAARAS